MKNRTKKLYAINAFRGVFRRFPTHTNKNKKSYGRGRGHAYNPLHKSLRTPLGYGATLINTLLVRDFRFTKMQTVVMILFAFRIFNVYYVTIAFATYCMY